MGTNVSTNYITCPAESNKTLGIKLPFLVMIIKNVSFNRSWRSTLPSKFKFSTTRMFAGASGPPTTNRQRESNPLSAQCQCDWMRAGTRSSSTCPISRGERMAQTTLRLWESRSTQTAEFEESTSLTDCTRRTNFLRSSNCSFPLQMTEQEQPFPGNPALPLPNNWLKTTFEFKIYFGFMFHIERDELLYSFWLIFIKI